MNSPEPGRGKITIQEPYIRGKVIVPKEYVGNVMELCQEKRGNFSFNGLFR